MYNMCLHKHVRLGEMLVVRFFVDIYLCGDGVHVYNV